MVFFVVIAVAVVLWLGVRWKIIQNAQDFWARFKFAQTLPGPAYFDIIGNATEERTIAWISELCDKYGHTYRIWFGDDLNVMVSDPIHIKAILSSSSLLVKSPLYKPLQPWLGQGLLTNGGAEWRNKRRLVTPAFHFNILGTFRTTIEECVNITVDKLSTLADGEQVIDIYPHVSLLSLDIICETAMGFKSNVQINSDSEFVRATQTVCQMLIEQIFSFWQRNRILFHFSPNGRKFRASLKVLHEHTKRVIQIRRNEMANERDISNDETIDNDVGIKRRFAFLDSLLQAQMNGAELTDKNIEDEVNTFMFAGHDTTSSIISFAIHELSQHQDIQKRLRTEVEATTDIDSMPFLDKVIKETLRLYPSVPYYARLVEEPFQLGDHIVPKGTSLTVLAYRLHRDPNLYPNPNSFNPDRYRDEDSVQPFAYVAFSAGPRNCIGQRYAQLELKCALSKFVREFDFLPVGGRPLNLISRLVLGSQNGFPVRLMKRV